MTEPRTYTIFICPECKEMQQEWTEHHQDGCSRPWTQKGLETVSKTALIEELKDLWHWIDRAEPADWAVKGKIEDRLAELMGVDSYWPGQEMGK